ncbi:MAG: hypothetical protein KAR05_00670 [Candidatus Omnitrophica bacterium]|nr:hypothetical protein [Candidatus Omnitrophota bacterium]
MKKNKLIFIAFILCCISVSCSPIIEFSKTVWGSSTRRLEQARVDAAKETFSCSLDECFDIVLKMAQSDADAQPPRGEFFDVFIKNRKKRHIVIMRVPGTIDTTAVGIFFTPLDEKTHIDVSSLSTNAKQVAAKLIFDEIKKNY